MSEMRMKIEFEELPFWQNVQSAPGAYSTMPFALEWSEEGFIKQMPVQDNQKRVVGQYVDPEYKFITTPPGSSAWGNRLGDAKLDLIRSFVPSLEGLSIMEIGAGSTYTAEKMLDAGARSCMIVDPAIKGAEQDPRIGIVREYFSKDIAKGKSFDLVVSINCLEHVEDPSSLLRDVRDILKQSGGTAFFSFPEISRQLLNGDLNSLLHEHINYFTKNSVENLMRKNGLRILKSETVKDSINLLLDVDSLCPESRTSEYMDEVYVAMPLHFQNSIRRVKTLLTDAVRYGERIAVHGATNGANNALFLAGLGGADNIFIFDGDELKTGRFLPLCPNPIQNTNTSEYRAFSKVYVSTLTFFEEIKRTLIAQHGFEDDQILPLFEGKK